MDAVAAGFAGLDSKAAGYLDRKRLREPPGLERLDTTYTQRSQVVD
jgi:hypothetical protein